MRRRLGLFVTFCLVLAALVGTALALGLGDLVYSAVEAWRLEAQVEEDPELALALDNLGI